jgi:hypothetical protein
MKDWIRNAPFAVRMAAFFVVFILSLGVVLFLTATPGEAAQSIANLSWGAFVAWAILCGLYYGFILLSNLSYRRTELDSEDAKEAAAEMFFKPSPPIAPDSDSANKNNAGAP